MSNIKSCLISKIADKKDQNRYFPHLVHCHSVIDIWSEISLHINRNNIYELKQWYKNIMSSLRMKRATISHKHILYCVTCAIDPKVTFLHLCCCSSIHMTIYHFLSIYYVFHDKLTSEKTNNHFCISSEITLLRSRFWISFG